MANAIKSIRTKLINEYTSEDGVLLQIEERDTAGNILLQEQYNDQGQVEQSISRSFNEAGHLLEETHSSYGEDPHQRLVHHYDDQDKITKVDVHFLDGSISYQQFTRNKEERTVLIEVVDEDGELEGKEFRKFDDEGRTLVETIHDDEGLQKHVETQFDEHGRPLARKGQFADGVEIDWQYQYEYNDKAQVIAASIQDVDGQLVRVERLSYDEAGNTSSHKVEDHKSGYGHIEHYEYDQNNRITRELKLALNESPMEETLYTYREDGLLSSEEKRTPRGVFIHQYQYEFF